MDYSYWNVQGTQQILTLAPDWQLPVVAILAIAHWDTGFGATTGPSMAAATWRQSGNCQSGSEWHHTLALATLATAGNCHWGPEWLPHWPIVANWLFMVIYYFFTFYTKVRWLDGSRVVPGIILAPLLLRWYGDVQLVSFFFLFVSFVEIIYFGTIFLDDSMWFPLFLAPLCQHVI